MIHVIESKLRRLWRGTNKYAVRSVPLSLLGGVHQHFPTVPFGSGEGRWDVPEGALTADWVCYSVGVGADASFDEDLAQRIGCTVVSFDPTPASVEYVRRLGSVAFRFVPWAIWTNEGHLDFFSQDLQNKVNLSVVDSGRGERLCRVECCRLQTAMERLEHSRLDLLKLDVEGAWLPIIEDVVASGIAPKVFCVEFDSPTSILRVRHAVRLLSRIGLCLVHRRRDNFLFVERSLLETM